ncbi:MAG: DUF3443 family protein, partial [Steroidobacterales bacterium]
GSGSGATGPNVVAMTVNAGPDGNQVDTPYITVTVCQHGSTTNCQQIPNVEVDTGSYGLRVISSVLNSSLATGLTQEADSSGNSIVECTTFVDGFSWGPVKVADVKIGEESASSVPVQVIGDPAYEQTSTANGTTTSEIPTLCSGSTTGPEEDTVSSFGANGILGVGPFGDDCGTGCQISSSNQLYYECPASSWSPGNPCNGAAVAESAQVTNPVVYFQTDNNGVIVQLPAIGSSGTAASASGSLIFGIGTEGNNGLGSATVFPGSQNTGDVTTSFNGQTLPDSYFDTGSNAYYFLDSSIPDCTSSGSSSSSWFCPASQQTLTAVIAGTGGSPTSQVTIYVGNATSLFNSYPSNAAFNNLGADSGNQSSYCTQIGASSGPCSFDFGLPFFFGRSLYVAIGGKSTSGGEGPYFAY